MMAALRGKHPKKAKIRKPIILVYGAPGAGKTWAAMDFPSVYYMDCEGGASLPHYTDKLEKAGGVYVGPEDGIDDINAVLAEIKTLATHKHEYKTVVIDSLSKVFNAKVSEKYEGMERSGKDMDKTFGREKKPAVAAIKQMLTWFVKMDMNIILICHQKDVWKDGKQTGYTFDAHDKLEYELDLVLRVVEQGPARKAIVGKSRLEQFTKGESLDWSYESFADRYGRSIIEGAVSPVALATKAQLAEVENLAEIFGLQDDARQKWWDKAGANSWSEMGKAEVQSCIDFFKKQIPALATA
jgi:hypothetical protein